MISKPIDQIKKSEINALISEKRTEIKTLEYKMKLPDRTDDAKKEFLADISSFANAAGGDVIYGIEPAKDENGKTNGEPKAIVPLVGQNPDETKLWLENSIRDGIAPKLPLQVKVIAGWDTDGKGFVILIRIPKSFAAPHMVTCKGTSRFFSRHSAGKYQLDVGEIRNAFLATDSQAERIKRFREDRLAKILADETPVRLSSPHRVVLHLIPLESFLGRLNIDLIKAHDKRAAFLPIYSGIDNTRFNLDGLLNSSSAHNNTGNHNGYCQVFRDGSIEAVHAGMLLGPYEQPKQLARGGIYSVVLEQAIATALDDQGRGLSELDISPPLVICLSLVRVKDFHMVTNRISPQYNMPLRIDRDNLIMPDVVIEKLPGDRFAALKPVFDLMWQSCGLARCFDYDNQGNWIGGQ